MQRDLSKLCDEISNFLNTLSIKVAKGYQCLQCTKLARDWFNMRSHLLTHILKDEGVMNSIDNFVKPNVIRHDSSSYSCLLCRKILKRSFGGIRAHFVAVHLKL